MESFLVQVWVPADDASRSARLRGVVRHVASGAETPFRNGEEVLHLLRTATRTATQTRPRRGADHDSTTQQEEVR